MGIIRLLLAAAVVLGHSSPIFGQTLGGGVFAVNCFFVISGFYMAMVLQKRYLRLPRRQWRTFMGARLLRLMPVYLTVVLATLAVVIKLGDRQPFGHLSDLSPASIAIVVVANVTLVGQDVMLFLGAGPGGGFHFTPDFWSEPLPAYRYMLIPPAWSVSLELGFYALAPRLVRLKIRWTILALAGSLVLRHLLVSAGYAQDPWSYRFFPTAIAYFLAGMLVYLCNALPSLQRRIGPLARAWGAPAALLAAVAIIFLAKDGQERSPSFIFVAPYVFALLVPAVFSLSKNSTVDRWIGDLSYPLYLVHVLVLTVLHVKNIPAPGAVLLPAALVASALLLIFIDQPVERYRQRRITALIDKAPRKEVIPARHAVTEPVA